MTSYTPYKTALLALFLATGANHALAHGGEDHGDAAAASPLGQALSPRAEAKSETFELLAELSGSKLQLYLDRYADNRPIQGARIEVESGAFKGVAVAAGDRYTLNAGPLAQPGKHPLVFTVTVGDEGDLLETTLQVGTTPPAPAHSNIRRWGWPLAGLAALLGLAAWRLIRRKHARKNP